MVPFGGERGTLQVRARLAKNTVFPNAPIYPKKHFHRSSAEQKGPLFYESMHVKRCAVRAVEAVLYGMVMRAQPTTWCLVALCYVKWICFPRAMMQTCVKSLFHFPHAHTTYARTHARTLTHTLAPQSFRHPLLSVLA
jgi:hypothetical protein